MKIDNTTIIETLKKAYTDMQKADCFILGFVIDNTVFFAEIPLQVVLDDFSGISMTSDETPCKRLRIKPLTKKTQSLFLTYSPQKLCDFQELQAIAKSEFSGNCGQCFEKLICDFYGGTLASANSKFWHCGDFQKNGIEYQCKFQNATIITEYSMQGALQNK